MKKKKKTSINDGDISLKKSEKGQVNQNEKEIRNRTAKTNWLENGRITQKINDTKDGSLGRSIKLINL